MKWKFCMVLFGLFFCFLLSSCATNNVFDKDLPPQQSAKLIISAALTIKTYNGIPVELKKGFMGKTGFTIPAGETELTFDIRSSVIAKNISLRYDFAGGNEYTLMVAFVDKEGKIKTTDRDESYFAIVLLQGNDTEEPLLVLSNFGQNEKMILN